MASSADTAGFHVYLARERNAFRFTPLATLTDSANATGSWTGHVCLTGSGRYVVAVYAPASYTNRPALMEAGGTAVVIDVATGAVHKVADHIQLAYYNPACGPTDRVLLTRAKGADEQRTDLIPVDAATSTAAPVQHVAVQFTNPFVGSDGAAYGEAHGNLVRVDADGGLDTLVAPSGAIYAVAGGAGAAIDIASTNGKQATIQRYHNGSLSTVATGQPGKLQLFSLSKQQDAILGASHSRTIPGSVLIRSAHRVAGVSRRGHLLVDSIVSKQAATSIDAGVARPNAADANKASATVTAVHSGHNATLAVHAQGGTRFDAAAVQAKPQAPGRQTTMKPADLSNASCLVPRDDIHRQALQPSTNMIEWAVDQAVHGDLTMTRPSNFLATGEPSYSPQQMFPLPSIDGAASGATVPAQVMLGILAQETNLQEASWHAVPGDAGNPLVSDYYGDRQSDGSTDINTIDYSKSDCGYGIGQVTTGMGKSSEGVYSASQEVAIATDYAANIAASLQILIGKWNSMHPDGLSVNNGDPKYVENWYLAIWAYNSGYYPSTDSSQNGGNYGVGWLNNPANPAYPPNRDGFLRDTYDDASHPSDWPYQERVLGWAETPQVKYDSDGLPYSAYQHAVFGSGGQLDIPLKEKLGEFCDFTNGCTYPSSDPCPAYDSSCWWHNGNATWASCATECSTESLAFSLGSSEPGIQRTYNRDCSTFDGSADYYKDSGWPVIMVDDLDNPGNNAVGCSGGTSNGKFTIRGGSPSGGADENPQVDLHQLGAGYQGHMWFTHVYPPDDAAADPSGGGNYKHEILGTWTPNLNDDGVHAGNYDILVHLPSHGAGFGSADYLIFNSYQSQSADHECQLDQDSDDGYDSWVSLGHYALDPGARVVLKNIGAGDADGTVDIAYDAMAFVPENGSTLTCGGLVATD